MGPNGSGKSTLAHVLAGRPGRGHAPQAVLPGARPPRHDAQCARARRVFLAFQYPVEIPGVSNLYFLKNAERGPQHRGCPSSTRSISSRSVTRRRDARTSTRSSSSARSTRDSPAARRSGTRSSRWRSSTRPRDLDETDSGLDIDALRIVASGVNSSAHSRARDDHRDALPEVAQLRRPGLPSRAGRGADRARGGKDLALELEEKGYAWLEKEPPAKTQPAGLVMKSSRKRPARPVSSARSRRTARSARRAIPAGWPRFAGSAWTDSAKWASRPSTTKRGGRRTSRRSGRCRSSWRPTRSRPGQRPLTSPLAWGRGRSTVFINGRYSRRAPRPGRRPGLEVASLKDVLAQDPESAEPHLAKSTR